MAALATNRSNSLQTLLQLGGETVEINLPMDGFPPFTVAPMPPLDATIAACTNHLRSPPEFISSWGNRPLEPLALEVEFFPMEEVLHEKVKIH